MRTLREIDALPVYPGDPDDLIALGRTLSTWIRVEAVSLARDQRLEAMNFREVRPDFIPHVDQHIINWRTCQACPLGQAYNCRNHVFFRGTIPADVLFIGEAPGQSEDSRGIPFIGSSGKLLNRILEEASIEKFGRPDGFTFAITNLVCCLPFDHIQDKVRPPSKKEIGACSSRLAEFINLVQPDVVIAVGSVAEKNIPKLIGPSYGVKPVHIAAIKHPSAIDRTDEADKEMEINRAMLRVKDALEYIVPF